MQFENRLLKTTMALSSKIKRATRMNILRRYHSPAVATCAIKSLISNHGFSHGDHLEDIRDRDLEPSIYFPAPAAKMIIVKGGFEVPKPLTLFVT